MHKQKKKSWVEEIAQARGEAFQIIEDSAPRHTYRGGIVSCGRMGSTIDDEHLGMLRSHPIGFNSLTCPGPGCWTSDPASQWLHRFEYHQEAHRAYKMAIELSDAFSDSTWLANA